MILQSCKMVALTGAGISAESGIPTFRGKEGLWQSYRAEELATPRAFARNPTLVWEWYQWRRRLIAGATCNAGHLALARLEERAPDFILITQNVDGLHQRAGSKRLLEIHGSIWKTRCIRCGDERENRDLDLKLPTCEGCGGLLRPAVVWFGEALDEKVLREATRAASECDLMLAVGTSGVVQPAASLPFMAKRNRATVIEINPEDTPVTQIADLHLRGRAAEILPQLVP